MEIELRPEYFGEPGEFLTASLVKEYPREERALE